MKITHQDIFDCIEKWAPTHLAFDWDPVGLQTGTPPDQTSKILVSLDVTEAVVDEAIVQGANLIIAHHPLLFKPLHSIDLTSQKGKILQKLMKHDITVYAAHTNLDIANHGVNDVLAQRIHLEHTEPLVKTETEPLLKLVIHVPKTHTDIVRQGLGDAGAGFIGAYSHCTFQTSGVGSFIPTEGTNPHIGKKNELTFVEEDQLETIIEEKSTSVILEKLNELHPYEEVAYDLYPVTQTATTYGLGRIGSLPDPTLLTDLCKRTKSAFEMEHLRFAGNKDKTIKKVALIGGSGEKYINHAYEAGADVLITGDVSFHSAQDAEEMGFSIIDAGHYIEKLIKKEVKQYLKAEIPTVDVLVSEVNTDPFHFM